MIQRIYEHPDVFVDVACVKGGVNLTLAAEDVPAIVLELDQAKAIDLASALLFKAGAEGLRFRPQPDGTVTVDYKLADVHPMFEVFSGKKMDKERGN